MYQFLMYRNKDINGKEEVAYSTTENNYLLLFILY